MGEVWNVKRIGGIYGRAERINKINRKMVTIWNRKFRGICRRVVWKRLKLEIIIELKKGLISKVKTINTPETRKQKHLGYTKRNVLLVNGRHTLNDIKTYSKNKVELVEERRLR